MQRKWTRPVLTSNKISVVRIESSTPDLRGLMVGEAVPGKEMP